ncbi:preprotein translocase subunit SecY [Rhodobacter sphaeroides]|jgi:preprotein translocase subunit SecY|uniref:Protein translocase subunit SecY n=1 Tax=Cereibacter sphaeroides (strain ATCC 17023 / DSM 158 / JCM 6121 / CCUG 31486 / LMG 2827 / NBRC 12203 / NCIMB 8253 / ATH 2.4.1.) TaxID=272943 RepID=Q3J5Q2_CERS4|nr:preprotein translocase subunit SecY [Cereibacter sphaeroides]ABA77882.1 protein translocase subunit secY/sec61 alpha [Cereibacter sphaeroides 2.4.1]AMJ46270.1 preprotein translocase subunit SecY [Cereibacter sphaeroides]ANS32982.1 preprotein translocase subunit SecY [Cereibacter sphaeroides]ATN62034.1 preprotein translocase subunit SecY [Cereibacter sphaeroides]AXC60122.1 preprotein translocase subunit SecY [Cereibacter sphaeroides 2.4.1]
MASAAEQMAANLSWGALGKATDLRQRIFFTIGLLMVYRLGTYIPVPGIDGSALRQFMDSATAGIGGMLNMFTGGAISRMGIFALGIMPYISASIIVQLMASMVPRLEQLKKEGEQGRKKINQYTRYGTVFLATFQAWGIAMSLEAGDLVTDPGLFFRAACVITLVGGTMFLMWLGEQITARGIGNGISLIIFVGIVAEIPAHLAQFLSQGRSGAISPAVIVGVIAMVIAVITFVVFMERALRKIHIQYPRRQVGMKVYDGGSSHLPVKVNPAGVIPAIFASSLLLLPVTISTFSGQQTGPVMSTILAYFGPGQPLYLLFFAGMIVFFAYFYTANVAFKVDDVAENLKNQNGFIPGIRPGKKTEEYLEYVVNRILVLGSAYLAAVCLLPEILRNQLGIPFYFGGTSVLIVVSVTMDTINQVQSHLLAHQYEGLIERSQLRGRKRTGAKTPTRR